MSEASVPVPAGESSGTQQGWGATAAQPDSRRWLILVVIAVAQLMVVLDATVMNIALPSAQRDLGFSNVDRQWIVTAYSLSFGSLLLFSGRLADLIGRKVMFITGLAGFAVASAIGGASVNFAMLVTARASQGVFGAILAPAALSLLATTFTDPKERGKAFGIYGSVAAGGGAVGLLLGGLLTDTLSWRWVFFINLPIGIVAFVLAARYIVNTRAEKRPETVDVLGASTVTAGLLVLVYDIVKAQQYGWTSGRTLGLFALAAALLGAFVVTELRSKAPLIRLGIFRVRSLTSANVAMLFVMSGLFGMFYFASIYVQEILGYSPLKAGVAFVPVTLGIVIGAGLAQPAISALGVRLVPIIGIALAALGLILLSGIPVHGAYLGDLFPGLMVMSIGMGLTFVPVTLIATTNIDAADSGLASGLFNTSQQVGGALGLAILSSVAASRTSAIHGVTHATALVDGFQLAFLIGAGLMLFAIVVIVALIRRRHVASIGAKDAVAVPA
jgi:EmrB/QacA subfamily drug resistance transporter